MFFLASLCSGEACRSFAGIAGRGAGAARWTLPTRGGSAPAGHCVANGAETAEWKGTLNMDFAPSR